jgi:hypothetical protein
LRCEQAGAWNPVRQISEVARLTGQKVPSNLKEKHFRLFFSFQVSAFKLIEVKTKEPFPFGNGSLEFLNRSEVISEERS